VKSEESENWSRHFLNLARGMCDDGRYINALLNMFNEILCELIWNITKILQIFAICQVRNNNADRSERSLIIFPTCPHTFGASQCRVHIRSQSAYTTGVRSKSHHVEEDSRKASTATKRRATEMFKPFSSKIQGLKKDLCSRQYQKYNFGQNWHDWPSFPNTQSK
jgi:hypothetical protein